RAPVRGRRAAFRRPDRRRDLGGARLALRRAAADRGADGGRPLPHGRLRAERSGRGARAGSQRIRSAVAFGAYLTGEPSVRNPRDFAKPLAIGAPDPVLEIPFKPSRMIHFVDFSNEKMLAKLPDIAPTVDILLGNLEDAVPVDKKEAAREGLVKAGKEFDFGETALWTRVNSLESPW